MNADEAKIAAVLSAAALVGITLVSRLALRRKGKGMETPSPGPEWSGGDVFEIGPSWAVAAADYALARFSEVGVDLPRENRLTRARRLVERVNARQIVLAAGDPETIRKVTEAQWTIFDLHLVARATGRSVAKTYLAKVRLALGGSDLPESDKNHLHRNTAFELVTAAIFTMGDIPVELAEPDIVVELDSRAVGVAAKRVQGERAIRPRMREARAQIGRSGRPGLIALNVDVITLNSRPLGDARSKGQTIDEKLTEVHKADDELVLDKNLLGRIAFARTANWSFDGDRPRLQQDMFRQARVYSRSEGEGVGVERDLARAESRIHERLQNL